MYDILETSDHQTFITHKRYLLMRQSFFIFLLFSIHILSLSAQSTVSILTWNIQDLGKTKDAQEIEFIAKIIRDYDVIAIQEVVAKDPAGARKVAEIVANLNRMGNNWDYRISPPTKSPSVYIAERYAYIWKSSRLQLKTPPELAKALEDKIEREPYLAEFIHQASGTTFTIANVHIRSNRRNPIPEIETLSVYPQLFPDHRLVIAGDFNITEKHKVWQPLHALGYRPSVRNAPTTLKRSCKSGKYRNYAIDNIYVNPSVLPCLEGGVIDYIGGCDNLLVGRQISDHLPVYCVLQM